MSPARSLVLLLVRWPSIGRVKTRLAVTLGEGEACNIHCRMAECCVANALSVSSAKLVVCGTGSSLDDFRRWLPGADDYWDQPCGGLGERLEGLFSRAFCTGACKVVAVGSDAPLLDAISIRGSLDALDDHDVSLLPATDGGYVLIGSRRMCPELFLEMPWSTDHLLARTMGACSRSALRVHVGPVHQDVDTEADWNRVRAEMPSQITRSSES